MVKYKCNKKYKKGGNWMSSPSPANSYETSSNSYNPPTNSPTNSPSMVTEATNWLDNIYKKIKTAIPTTSKTSTPNYQTSYQTPMNNQPSYPPYGASYGGKKTKKGRCGKKGGYGPSRSLTNVASAAYPVNGIPTAKSQVWVGGKKLCTRRHKHKSCKTRKSKRHM